MLSEKAIKLFNVSKTEVEKTKELGQRLLLLSTDQGKVLAPLMQNENNVCHLIEQGFPGVWGDGRKQHCYLADNH